MWKSLLENIQGIVLMVGLGLLALEDIKTRKVRSMSIIVFALAGLAAVFLIVVYHKGKKELLPFVPFLFLAHLIVVLL